MLSTRKIVTFNSYIATPALLAFLLFIFITTYVSQISLRDAQFQSSKLNIESHAASVSYFYRERKNDILHLAKSKSIEAFFANSALGMSMQYGLRSSLLTMQSEFQQLIDGKSIYNHLIYRKLSFISNEGESLVEVGSHNIFKAKSFIKKNLCLNNQPEILIISDGAHYYPFVCFPYRYKGKQMGIILAEVNHTEALSQLLSPEETINPQYQILLSDPAKIISVKGSNRNPSGTTKGSSHGVMFKTSVEKQAYLNAKISGTPFLLSITHGAKGAEGFLTSPWYLVSLALVALLVLFSVIIGYRTRITNILLQSRVDESRKSKELQHKKNLLLNSEVRKRKDSEARLKTIVETIPDLVWLKDSDGIYITCNQKFASFFGASENKIKGKTDYDFVDKALADFFRHNDLAAMRAGCPLVNEEEVTFADDGHTELLETIKTPMLNNEGELVGVLGIARDITERRKTAELIEHQAAFDSLTDLPNRRLLIVRLNQSIANCNRHNYFSAVLFIDLDNFKNINDSLGHPVGDELLKQVAKRMVSELREGDTASRLGGDEFVVLLMELSDNSVKAAELAKLGAEKIRNNLSRSYVIDKNTLHITVSIGIALIPMENDSADNVLKFADNAMYHAKKAGRNTIRFFLPRMQIEVEERLRLQNDLHQAIIQNELELFFQPKINSKLNIVGAEVLLRWSHSVRGNVAPDIFIPAAEESGLILEIGEWVFKSSFIQMGIWAKQLSLPENFHIAINVSPHQFRQESFITNIERLLGETGVNPKHIIFELTEGVLVENINNTIIKINSLKKLGIHLSIDDFGTGFSSLAYLKQLPVQELKIDRSFIRDINSDQSDASLVETIIMLALQFNLNVVAEGVEKVEQYKFLSTKGCGSYQGYFFERPMAEEAFTKLLNNNPNYSINIK